MIAAPPPQRNPTHRLHRCGEPRALWAHRFDRPDDQTVDDQ